MAIDLSQFQETFFEESAEHVETMEGGLLELEHRTNDLDLLNKIFRAAHSIKGNAGMFHFTAVGELTHKMENILDRLRNNEMNVTKGIIDLLLKGLDSLKELLEEAHGGDPADEEAVRDIVSKLLACYEGGAGNESGEGTAGEVPAQASPSAGSRRISIAWSPLPELFQRGLDPSQIFQELQHLGTLHHLTVDTDRFPPLDEMDPEVCYLSWTMELDTDKPVAEVEAVFEFVRDGSELTIVEEQPDTPAQPEVSTRQRIGEILIEEGTVTEAQVAAGLSKQKPLGQILVEDKAATPQQVEQALNKQHQQKKKEVSSIRVDTEKIDKVINLVGELVITQSMLTDLGEKFTMPQLPLLQERIVQLERNTREMQERVMAIRMLPIGNAFNRFPRLVRDLSAKSGKAIELLMSGEETELDKTLIEAIGDPLTHLVRNSADHGLETPEKRVAAGKPKQGTIRLNAFYDGGNICVSVEDDGRGLNREKILAKAKERGLIDQGAAMTDEEVWQLIFRPGFSTADKVTEVSGRGVGMDVVKRNIEGLGGSVRIQSTEGKGSIVTLKLPLTLAIIDGMTVRVGGESYIIPLLTVIQSISPTSSDIQTMVGRGEVFNLRGEWIPMVRLYEVFGVTPDGTDPMKALLVIVEADGKRVALFVDELIGQQQVVIKSLEENYRKIDAISGATILGDGQVALILDVPGLVELSKMAPVAA